LKFPSSLNVGNTAVSNNPYWAEFGEFSVLVGNSTHSIRDMLDETDCYYTYNRVVSFVVVEKTILRRFFLFCHFEQKFAVCSTDAGEKYR
jgi:hypothetical protein